MNSCENEIQSGKKLNGQTLEFITKLGLLENDESINSFYCNFEEDKAGNFFTNKRIASYWISDNEEESDTNSAFYTQIVKIDTVYLPSALDCSFMTITRKDSSSFKVYVKGNSRLEERKFFENAIKLWTNNK
jgi:hypothetical protein